MDERRFKKRNLFLLLYIVFALLPIYWMVNMSLRTNEEILSSFALFPDQPTFANYATIFTDPSWYNGYINSLIYVAINTVISLTVALPAAYAFSRYRFLGDKHVFFWLLTNRMTGVETIGGTQYVCTGWSLAGNGSVAGGATNVVLSQTKSLACTSGRANWCCNTVRTRCSEPLPTAILTTSRDTLGRSTSARAKFKAASKSAMVSTMVPSRSIIRAWMLLSCMFIAFACELLHPTDEKR
jgi:hypothetical protein